MAEKPTGGTGKSLDEKLTTEEATAFYENVSDRASALVLANIVENRLTELLRLQMRDDKALADELFNPSGPLGPFGTKIRVAYMFGLLSPEAHKRPNDRQSHQKQVCARSVGHGVLEPANP
jgi:hypothetical protein